MKTFLDIVEAIKDIVSEDFPNKKIFDKDIADLLDISHMNFATMKRRNRVPLVALLDFCAKRSISINWLLYGQSPESLIDSTNRFYTVRYFSQVNASAGGGAGNDNEESQPLILESNFVQSLGGESELKNIEAINVTGDSMEPLFNYGDIVFVNRTKCDINRGGVFTINTEHGLFIKRIQKRIDGKIDIISDNKDYQTMSVYPNEIEIVGRVVGRFGGVY